MSKFQVSSFCFKYNGLLQELAASNHGSLLPFELRKAMPIPAPRPSWPFAFRALVSMGSDECSGILLYLFQCHSAHWCLQTGVVPGKRDTDISLQWLN